MTDRSMQFLYEKFLNGDSLTDEELLKGARWFKRVGDELAQLGPVFSLQTKELRLVADRMSDYLIARGRS